MFNPRFVMGASCAAHNCISQARVNIAAQIGGFAVKARYSPVDLILSAEAVYGEGVNISISEEGTEAAQKATDDHWHEVFFGNIDNHGAAVLAEACIAYLAGPGVDVESVREALATIRQLAVK